MNGKRYQLEISKELYSRLMEHVQKNATDAYIKEQSPETRHCFKGFVPDPRS